MIKNSKTPKVIFIISLIVFAFFLLGNVLVSDIYRYAIVGVIFELLWLPMLLLLLVLPVISVLVFINQKGKSKIYAALSVLFIISSIIIMIS